MTSDLPDCVNEPIDDSRINEYLVQNGFFNKLDILRDENRGLTKEVEALRKIVMTKSRNLDNALNDSTLARRRAADLQDRLKREVSLRQTETSALKLRVAQLQHINSKLECEKDRLREKLRGTCGNESSQMFSEPHPAKDERELIKDALEDTSDARHDSVSGSNSGMLSPGSIMKGLSISSVEPFRGPLFEHLGG